MKRKLIQLSPSTAVVSMPSSWIQKNKLKKGEEVFLQQVENNILISTNAKRIAQSVTVNLKGLSQELTFAYADASYIAGYDEITYLIDPHQVQQITQYVATEVPGMIITSQSKSKVVFKDITNNHQEDVDSLIVRVFHMITSMIEDARVASMEKDWEGLRGIKRQDHVINSYIAYAQRLINKFGYVKFSKTGLIITYLKLLEMFSDLCAGIAKIASKEKLSSTKEFEHIKTIFSLLQKTHLGYDQKKVVQVQNDRSILTTIKKPLKEHMNRIRELCYELIEIDIQYHL